MSALRTATRLLVALAIIALLCWLVASFTLARWVPSRETYPLQGMYVDESDGDIAWPTVHAMGANFGYFRATIGAEGRDAQFAYNMREMAAADMRHGPVHLYDLCVSASDQAANFITTVPRNEEMLPPAVRLGFDNSCPDRPTRSRVLGELNVFLNQIEGHSGKPAVLQITRDFEAVYSISSGIDRNVWLIGDFFPPDYAARPWVMWQATSRVEVVGASGPVRWLVVRP